MTKCAPRKLAQARRTTPRIAIDLIFITIELFSPFYPYEWRWHASSLSAALCVTYCAASDGPPTRLEGAERLPLASSDRTKYSTCSVEGDVSENAAVGPLAVTRVMN